MGGDPCATILQLDPIKLVGFVPEADVGRVTVGAPAGARLVEGGTVSGKVTFVSRSADETTRTFRVEIEVPNADLAISRRPDRRDRHRERRRAGASRPAILAHAGRRRRARRAHRRG